ncbi:phospholipase D family protein [Dongia soli]|uniref:Phospholipase D family protein n=1 Tax=Dongia soli TaxID=600628 RepID=A0ABU5EHR7_9PROT|nr:phospholipase D family protein [Dongia soli]MDY0885427.1 phospholipase D family protein [Dongia soli]
MRLIMGGINGYYLQNITGNCASETNEVLAAVAYASDSRLLFDWCWENRIPIKFYGRLDDRVAVSVAILSDFLNRRSSNYVCRLVQHHHAKVIWWRGAGVYIGSANLTDRAWYSNVEAGCFFPENEITDEMAGDLLQLFATLDAYSTPLTEEAVKEMRSRELALNATSPSSKNFWASPSFKTWPGLIHTAPKTAQDRKHKAFLEEWHSTLQDLRSIAAIVSLDENRPHWVNPRPQQELRLTSSFMHLTTSARSMVGRPIM